jgi:HAD superfamily hydrolase (TIGR01490 family)
LKKKIAFFDFDGTITKKDTLLEFIKFNKGDFHFYLGFLLKSPYLVAYKLNIISNQAAKEKVLQFFFGRMNFALFQERCDQFATDIVPGLVRPKALEEIKKLQKDGVIVVIVSSSPENWISSWARMMQVKLIGTRLEVKEDRVTGKILDKNCHGKEKVKRIQKEYDLSEYSEIYAYGDTAGDEPMLALANFPFMKPFR